MAEQLKLEDLKKRRMGPPLPPRRASPPTQMADSAGATGGPSFSRNPYASETGNSNKITNTIGTSFTPRQNNNEYTRGDLFKGANSEGSILRNNSPQKKPIINMRAGMGNSPDGYNRANGVDIGDASTELLGSAVHMMQKKGKSFSDARQSLQTLDTFKGLSESGRKYALDKFDRWQASQVGGTKDPTNMISKKAMGANSELRRQPQSFSQTRTVNPDTFSNSK